MNILELFKPVKTFVFDMDGVLTDGMLTLMPGGVMARRMNIKDGYALQAAIKKGYRIAVISGAYSKEATERLNKLGITDIFMGVENKLECLMEYLSKNSIDMNNTLFMGDDIPDYEVMQKVGLSCCPADAAPEIRNISKYVSIYKGGEGCVRDVVEKVLKLNNDWDLHTTIKAK